MTNLGMWSPFSGSLGWHRTLVDGSLESPCRPLVMCIELLFLSLTVKALQGKTCQNSLLSGGGGSIWANTSGKGSSLRNLFWFLEN